MTDFTKGISPTNYQSQLSPLEVLIKTAASSIDKYIVVYPHKDGLWDFANKYRIRGSTHVTHFMSDTIMAGNRNKNH
jgi:hypothetical protein